MHTAHQQLVACCQSLHTFPLLKTSACLEGVLPRRDNIIERYMWVLGLAPWGWVRMLVRVRAPLDPAWGPELAVPHPRHLHCWS